MRSRISFLLTLSIVLIGISFSAFAQKVATPKPGATGTWRMLGTISAKSSGDHDVIVVRGPYDYFRKLKFKVTDSKIEIRHMIVRYDDKGAPEKIEVRQEIPKGGESREINLKGGKRKLKSVEFWYSDRGFMNGKADLTLFAKK